MWTWDLINVHGSSHKTKSTWAFTQTKKHFITSWTETDTKSLPDDTFETNTWTRNSCILYDRIRNRLLVTPTLEYEFIHCWQSHLDLWLETKSAHELYLSFKTKPIPNTSLDIRNPHLSWTLHLKVITRQWTTGTISKTNTTRFVSILKLNVILILRCTRNHPSVVTASGVTTGTWVVSRTWICLSLYTYTDLDMHGTRYPSKSDTDWIELYTYRRKRIHLDYSCIPVVVSKNNRYLLFTQEVTASNN